MRPETRKPITIIDLVLESEKHRKAKPRTRTRTRARRPDPANYLFTGLIVGIVLAWIAIRVGDHL